MLLSRRISKTVFSELCSQPLYVVLSLQLFYFRLDMFYVSPQNWCNRGILLGWLDCIAMRTQVHADPRIHRTKLMVTSLVHESNGLQRCE
jgi:hypothetical protein